MKYRTIDISKLALIPYSVCGKRSTVMIVHIDEDNRIVEIVEVLCPEHEHPPTA